MNKRWLSFIATAAALAIVYGLWDQRFIPGFISEREIEVKVATAKKVFTLVIIEKSGQLQASKSMDVVSVVPGVVKEIRKIGAIVKAGEVVAVVDSKSLTERLRLNESAVKAAAAKLQEVKGRLEETEKKLAVVREAYDKELIARRDVEVMAAAAETTQLENERARAQLAQSEAALAQTRYLLTLTRVVAPVGGVVANRTVEPGATVAAYTQVLALADPTILHAVIRLNAAEARLLHPGTAVTVRVPALPGKVFNGSVARVTEELDGKDPAPTAEIEVRNSDGTLKPNLDVLVSMTLDQERERITIPYTAVFEHQGKPCVYVISDQKARLRCITTGAQESGDIIVTSGLAEGERVVVEGQSKLRDNSAVRIVER